jgi:hypothetical protein
MDLYYLLRITTVGVAGLTTGGGLIHCTTTKTTTRLVTTFQPPLPHPSPRYTTTMDLLRRRYTTEATPIPIPTTTHTATATRSSSPLSLVSLSSTLEPRQNLIYIYNCAQNNIPIPYTNYFMNVFTMSSR